LILNRKRFGLSIHDNSQLSHDGMSDKAVASITSIGLVEHGKIDEALSSLFLI